MAKRPPAIDVAPWVRQPGFAGISDVTLVARKPLWDPNDLPFDLHGGGTVLRVEPDPAFPKDALAGTGDERLLIVDCPDAPGWLVPSGLAAAWMQRNVRNDALDDLLLAHPLYEHLTQVDRQGRSRGGRQRLVSWVPGVPTIAAIAAPEYLPRDTAAPPVNRDPQAYAVAVNDLLAELAGRFDAVEVEVGARFARA